ncbi:MAG: DUF2933 domain-containing protein [bacterium]
MKIERKWLWLGGAVVGAGGALALGVPLGTLLIVAAVLACPLMMLFGMRGMHQGAGGMAQPPASHEKGREAIEPPASSIGPSSTEQPARKS